MRSLPLVTAALVTLTTAQTTQQQPSSTVLQIWFPPQTQEPLRPSSASAATPTFTGYPRLSASLVHIDASQNLTTLSLACVLPSSVCATQPEGVRTLTVGPGVYIAPLYEIRRQPSASRPLTSRLLTSSLGSAVVPVTTSGLGTVSRPSVTVPVGVPSRVFSVPTEGVTSAAVIMMERRQENDDDDNGGGDGSTTSIYTSSCTYSLTPTATGQCLVWTGSSTASTARTYAASLVVLSDVTITAGLEKLNATPATTTGTVVSSQTVIVSGSQTFTTTVPVTTSNVPGAAAAVVGRGTGGVVAAVVAAVAAAFV